METELERERFALELEEEKRAQAERERRLQEQARKIENLSTMVLYSSRGENREQYKKVHITVYIHVQCSVLCIFIGLFLFYFKLVKKSLLFILFFRRAKGEIPGVLGFWSKKIMPRYNLASVGTLQIID